MGLFANLACATGAHAQAVLAAPVSPGEQVLLGLRPDGALIAPKGTPPGYIYPTSDVYYGLYDVPERTEIVGANYPFEGWGLADTLTSTEGHAAVTGSTVTIDSFTSAVSTATSGAGMFRVTHAVAPATANTFRFVVTIHHF
ncbi:hypothetical protein [Ottowia sp.]|uniref:hypothetical protein n=1 Tax=Ottowia sp. TaxID=1898956 RepID=UPI003A845641